MFYDRGVCLRMFCVEVYVVIFEGDESERFVELFVGVEEGIMM